MFAGDLGDIFQDHVVVNRLRPRLWETMKATSHLVYYVSTKVPGNIMQFLPDDWGDGYPNVWLVVTVTSPRTLRRMDVLRKVPAALRAVSAEPLWQPLTNINLDGFAWMIVGARVVHNGQRARCGSPGPAHCGKRLGSRRWPTRSNR